MNRTVKSVGTHHLLQSPVTSHQSPVTKARKGRACSGVDRSLGSSIKVKSAGTHHLKINF
ncbi:hypothetical protein CKA32_006745 [Geitlerinema sp. FC II]|nr:hypothetical protein CKA32_006745 [Geitlerinema sp. FC II]